MTKLDSVTYRYSFDAKELSEKLGIKLGALSHANIGETSGKLWLDVTTDEDEQPKTDAVK